MRNLKSRRAFFKNALAVGALAPIATFGQGLQTAVEKTSMSSIPTDLKITDIKCGFIRNGHSLFVKIYTNQDIVGHGEGVFRQP